ncbi:response regulator [Stieleria sp. JC731]|uniref:response regulator n=1 Tax=Pirellulaceae TaxID=2691357 RepID=UPI001E5C3C41|nr:response regulator [Stieleria sp. JC731]MCC9600149.1 response regulator [Stieleria sp. JC731]
MTATQPSANAPDRSTASPQETHTVLVADDSMTVLRLIDRTLREAGYRVLLAEDGRQAVSCALTEHPDLVVLDINMPELDGYGVCHELLANPTWESRTPVIFLTSAEEPHLSVLGEELGAFLSKPTEPELLLKTVATLISQRANAR